MWALVTAAAPAASSEQPRICTFARTRACRLWFVGLRLLVDVWLPFGRLLLLWRLLVARMALAWRLLVARLQASVVWHNF